MSTFNGRTWLPIVVLVFLRVCLLPHTRAFSYHLAEEYVGKEFLRGFEIEAIPDPTHGRVDYVNVNASVAFTEGLVQAHWNRFVMRADSHSVLTPDGPGQNSVRLKSKNAYENGVMV